MNNPLTWAEFRALSNDGKRTFLEAEKAERGVSYKSLAEMFYVTPSTVTSYFCDYCPELRVIVTDIGTEISCEICGKKIIKKAKSHTKCPECAHSYWLNGAKERQARYREKQRNQPPKPVAVVVSNKPTLAEVNEAARKHGMSYGQYVTAWRAGKVAPPEKLPKKKKRGRPCKGT